MVMRRGNRGPAAYKAGAQHPGRKTWKREREAEANRVTGGWMTPGLQERRREPRGKEGGHRPARVNGCQEADET